MEETYVSMRRRRLNKELREKRVMAGKIRARQRGTEHYFTSESGRDAVRKRWENHIKKNHHDGE